MIPYLTCSAAHERLEPYLDGELLVEEQVALDAHLRWCVVCRGRLDDMKSIGEVLRLRHRNTVGSDAVPMDLSGMRSSVLERVKAEDEQSWPARVGRAFADRRLLWPALGASAAVCVCVVLASGVLSALAEVDERESLAAMIETLAHPGTDENPLVIDGHVPLDQRVSMPRALDPDRVLKGVLDDDVAFAVSAVVTREGRVSTPELLMSERASGRRRQGAAELDVDAPAVMDAVKRSRFTPATGAQGPVAVNVVWLVTRTTVKASQEAAPVKRARPVVVPARPVVVPVPPVEAAPVEPPITEAPAPPSATA